MSAETESIQTLPNGWKPYPAYKDSGIEWLGDIPEHWEEKRLKNICVINPEKLSDKTSQNYEIEYLDISSVDSIGRILKTEHMYFGDAPSRARRRVENGDTIISTVRTYLKAISYLNNPPENLIVSTGFSVLRASNGIDKKYLNQLVKSHEFVEQVVAESKGVAYPAINPTELATLPVWLPPYPEQKSIAAFLDRETAKIDDLIAKKEHSIALLEEKRQAMISRAVTKGLDPDAPMKDSGIEWIGEIPVGWEVKRLKNIADINSEVLSEMTSPDFEMKYVDISNVDSNGSIIGYQDLIFGNAPSRARRIVRNGDTIVSTVRTYLRAIAFINNPPSNLIVSTGFAVLRAKNDVVPQYLFSLARCEPFIQTVMANSVGVGYPAINPSVLSSLPAWLPPLEEQKSIAAFLDRETEKIDKLVDKIKEQIEKLKEYRTALISAAVTGKIDVRGET